MSIYAAIRTILVADSALTGLVGQKVFANAAPQGTQLPFIVMNVISNTPTNTKQEASTMDRFRVQISSFGNDFDNCQAVKNRVRILLENINKVTSVNVAIQNSQFQNEVDGIEQLSSLDGVFYNYSDYYFFATR